MKINFTQFLRDREDHLANEKLKATYATLIHSQAAKLGIEGKIAIEYFQTGAIVTVDGEYYNTWNYKKQKFHEGFVGDY